MATTAKWTIPTTTACIMTTELNALSAGSNAAGSAIANSASLYTYADLELYLGHTASLGSGGYIAAYWLTALDGTNYSDGSTSVDPPANMLFGVFPLRAIASGSQRVPLLNVLVPPETVQVLLDNQSGSSALAAVGNELRVRYYYLQSV